MLGKIKTITNIQNASSIHASGIQVNKNTFNDRELQKLFQNSEKDNFSSSKSKAQVEEKKVAPHLN